MPLWNSRRPLWERFNVTLGRSFLRKLLFVGLLHSLEPFLPETFERPTERLSKFETQSSIIGICNSRCKHRVFTFSKISLLDRFLNHCLWLQLSANCRPKIFERFNCPAKLDGSRATMESRESHESRESRIILRRVRKWGLCGSVSWATFCSSRRILG